MIFYSWKVWALWILTEPKVWLVLAAAIFVLLAPVVAIVRTLKGRFSK
jgi:hypothetical protein